MRDNLLPVSPVNDTESVSLKFRKIACTHRHIFYVVNRIEQRNSKKKKKNWAKKIHQGYFKVYMGEGKY